MDKTTLVEHDFKDGEMLIKELDKANINVQSALWLYDSEADNWRLIIASKITDLFGPKQAYSQINNVLKQMKREGKDVDFALDNISVVSPNHHLIKVLGSVIRTGPDEISGIRFSRNGIGNSYIEDSYIYRIQ